MVEGEELAIDTLMYRSYNDGSSVQRVLVPVAMEEHPSQSTHAMIELGPSDFIPEQDPSDFILEHDQSWPDDIGHVQAPSPDHAQDRWFHMKEFVSRVDGILEAMQDKEGLPDRYLCAEYNITIGHWRCKECIGCNPLCRQCMCHSHFANLFHRIEYWTGSHFRPAALWEVGVYIMLTHQRAPSMCATLIWQKGILEGLQATKDQQTVLSNHPHHQASNSFTGRSAAPRRIIRSGSRLRCCCNEIVGSNV